MGAKMLVDHEAGSAQRGRRKKFLPAQARPAIESRKSYAKPQFIFETDLEIIPACWVHPCSATTPEDLTCQA
jgi:hypothetical protein